MSALQPGETFSGYTVERLLGAGGMGEVYVARHPRLPRSDALKVLAAGLADDDRFRKRFEREADVVAGFSHPNIVKVYDRGETDGRLWIALELVDGQDLAARLRAGQIPVPIAVRYVGEIAAALDDAAAHGLVHRDVKPANILIDRHDRALLTDFGIAQLTAEAAELTGTGMTVGTVTFASPEQLQGEPVDPRADQYALACTAFLLLTGTTPYSGNSAGAILVQHVTAPVPSAAQRNPHLPPTVDAVFARALAKNPAERYPSSRAFAEALADALGSALGPVSPEQPTAVTSAPATPTLTPAPAPQGSPAHQPPVQPPAAQPVPRRAPPPNIPPHSAPPGFHPGPPAGPIDPAFAATATGPSTGGAVDPRKRPSRRMLAVIGTSLVAVVAVVVALVLTLGGGDGDGAAQNNRAAENPVMSSLATAPAAPKWTFTAPDSRPVYAVGGNERYVMMSEETSTGATVYVVDAESGKSVRTIQVPGSGENLRTNPCLPLASGDKVVCNTGTTTVPRSGYADTYAIIDLASGSVHSLEGTPTSVALGATRAVVSGDTVVVMKNGRGKIVAYDANGHEKWSVPRAETPYNLPAQGSPVIAVADGDFNFSVRDIASGKTLYAYNTVTAEVPIPADQVVWAPFRSGFAVQVDDHTDIYDATGTKTSTVGGFFPVTYDLIDHPAALPVLSPAGADLVGAFDPGTGRRLGSVHLGAVPRYIIGAVGTKVAVDTQAGPGIAWFDVQDGGSGTFTNSLARLVGTDGTRVLFTLGSAGFGAFAPGSSGPLWQQETDDRYTLIAVGNKLYDANRRLI